MNYHLKREQGRVTEALPIDPQSTLKTWDGSLNLLDVLVFSASMLAVLLLLSFL